MPGCYTPANQLGAEEGAPWIAVFLGGTRQQVSRWKGRVVAGLDGVAVVA